MRPGDHVLGKEGVFAGTSAGLDAAAARKVAAALPPEAVVLTIAIDTGRKHLAGDLYRFA
ncbi:MAG: hypothetical protein QOE90_527 [Thermoplasmata archaeon]|nr:hypothetical protein [Thermoplasmata archaeon]